MGTQKEPAAAEESYFIAHCTLWLSNFQGAGPPSDTIPHSIKITIIAVASSEVGQSTRVQWRSEVAGHAGQGRRDRQFLRDCYYPNIGRRLLLAFGSVRFNEGRFIAVLLNYINAQSAMRPHLTSCQ